MKNLLLLKIHIYIILNEDLLTLWHLELMKNGKYINKKQSENQSE